MQLEELTVGFIGAGNMAEAIAGALINANTALASNILMADIDEGRLKPMAKAYAVKTTTDNLDVFVRSKVVVLAVKPQKVAEVVSALAQGPGYAVAARKQFISICAGVRIEKLESMLYPPLSEEDRKRLPIIRVMPNTPALVLEGMSAMSPNRNATAEDLDLASTLLESMGRVLSFEETLLDAVTAMSGSGPAYLFYLAEALERAGEKLGFSGPEARTLTLQTLKGAVALLEKSGDAPEALRRKVTSPGGTTQAATDVLDAAKVMETVVEAVCAAARRSKELSE
ncbi:MAG: pyrroline-5-carboxylate reductase [Desulfobacterales bacterium]|nr:pyrroline-5-carboxylate reductase [Desulfobacterales bacterium]